MVADRGSLAPQAATDDEISKGTSTLCYPPRCPLFFDRSGMPVLVQPFHERDRGRLIRMYETVVSTTFGLPPKTYERLERWLADLSDRGWNLVARDGDRIVGHIGVAPADDPAPEIVIFVHDDYHNQGIGTELIRQAIAYAILGEYEELIAIVERGNHRALSVFRGLGFEPIDDGIVEIWVRLILDHSITESVLHQPVNQPNTR